MIKKYESAEREVETNLIFVEKSLQITRSKGIFGMILPNTCLYLDSSRNWRNVLLHYKITEIIEYSKRVFVDAPDIVPIVLITQGDTVSANNEIKTTSFAKYPTFREDYLHEEKHDKIIEQNLWLKTRNNVFILNIRGSMLGLFRKVRDKSVEVSETADVFYGIKTGNNKKYVSEEKKDNWVKALKTGEISKYYMEWKGFYLHYGKHLAGYTNRDFKKEKIVIQRIRKLSLKDRLICALDESGIYYPLDNYTMILNPVGVSLKYILGVLNSNLLNFYYANTYIDYNVKPTFIRELPIREINFSDPGDVEKHDRMVALVGEMLDLHKRLAAAKSDSDKTRLERAIKTADTYIDALVYDLYGLTDEEIKVVENG